MRSWRAGAPDVLSFDCTNRLCGWDDMEKTMPIYPNDFSDMFVGTGHTVFMGTGVRLRPTYEGFRASRPLTSSVSI